MGKSEGMFGGKWGCFWDGISIVISSLPRNLLTVGGLLIVGGCLRSPDYRRDLVDMTFFRGILLYENFGKVRRCLRSPDYRRDLVDMTFFRGILLYGDFGKVGRCLRSPDYRRDLVDMTFLLGKFSRPHYYSDQC